MSEREFRQACRKVSRQMRREYRANKKAIKTRGFK